MTQKPAARKRPATKKPAGPASVVEAVTIDLELLPADLGRSGIALGMLALAAGIDAPRNSLTSKALAFRELCHGLAELRALAATVPVKGDKIDELNARRAKRHDRVAEA